MDYDDKTKDYLLQLHKDNSIFFNKLLQAVPFAFIGGILCLGEKYEKMDLFLMKFSLLVFVLSVIIQSISFIFSTKAAEDIGNDDSITRSKGWFYNDLTIVMNNLTLACNIIGLVLITISYIKGTL